MSEARLQRTRAAYAEPAEPVRDHAFFERERLRMLRSVGLVEEASYNFGPPCWCAGLPNGFDLAQCPAHPTRTLRRGPVGTTN